MLTHPEFGGSACGIMWVEMVKGGIAGGLVFYSSSNLPSFSGETSHSYGFVILSISDIVI